MSIEEVRFLKEYDSSIYEKPSVAADILVFTLSEDDKLQVLLVKRGGHPFKGKWAVPGGFVGMKESLEDAAKRKLKEETGLADIYLEQLYTFGSVDRDPRMRVISIAYMALVPKERLILQAGEEESEAELFTIEGNVLSNKKETIKEEDLAFDHAKMINYGLHRLQNKLSYTDIGFELLHNKNCFTIYELKKIYEAILMEDLDLPNFRRSFKNKYEKTGRVKVVGKTKEFSKRESSAYQIIEEGLVWKESI